MAGLWPGLGRTTAAALADAGVESITLTTVKEDEAGGSIPIKVLEERTRSIVDVSRVRRALVVVLMLAGLAAGWAFRALRRESVLRWLTLAVFPALSGLLLIVLGLYAMTTFDIITNIVGIGGLVAGIVFFRPRSRARPLAVAH